MKGLLLFSFLFIFSSGIILAKTSTLSDRSWSQVRVRKFEELYKNVKSKNFLVEVDGKISNGMVATPNQFPYQSAMFLENVNGFLTFCAGSIVSPFWIISAAHCLIG